jgi:hypothetical protein
MTGSRFSYRNLVAAWINMEEHLIRFDAGIVRSVDVDDPARLIFPS